MAQARMVKSLLKFRDQVNKLAPKRSKASDGWIGDSKHSMRKSDHNPEPDGTVDAFDLTHDPKNGVDIAKVRDALIASKDRRISYIICNGEIIAGRNGPKPWVRRKYDGSNGHFKHIHISILDENQDDETAWMIDAAFGKIPDNLTTKQVSSVMHKGASGEFVEELQKNLNKLGFGTLVVDGSFGASTEKAVRAFQRAHSLEADGWAGPRTLEVIGKELSKLKLKPKIVEAEKKADVAEKKAKASESVVDDAAAKGKRFSTTEVVSTVTGVTGVATAVKEGVDAIKESTSSLYDIAATVGPWIVLGLVLAGGAIYIINERRNKRLEAKKVQQVIESGDV